MKANKKLITCKVEGTYGVDATPAVGTDDLLVMNCSVTPINIRYTERNSAQPFFGNRGQINVGETMQMEYDIEIAGAGAVADVPGYAAAMRGCAMAETITPTTGPVTYNFISDAEESVARHTGFERIPESQSHDQGQHHIHAVHVCRAAGITHYYPRQRACL